VRAPTSCCRFCNKEKNFFNLFAFSDVDHSADVSAHAAKLFNGKSGRNTGSRLRKSGRSKELQGFKALLVPKKLKRGRDVRV
jgi:hypothetical protein